MPWKIQGVFARTAQKERILVKEIMQEGERVLEGPEKSIGAAK